MSLNKVEVIELSDNILLGDGCVVEDSAFVGYAPGRKIPDLRLEIGHDGNIRSGTIIYLGSRIGNDLETGHNVVIREENVIGDSFSVWSNSVIDYGCVIGDNVRIHCNVYVAQFTAIEDDVFVAPGVMIANDRHPICTHCMKGPIIRRGARIGINVTLLPQVEIGEFSFIGAGSVVTRNVPPKSVAYGNPAVVVGTIDELVCRSGLVEKPYDDGKDVRCRECLGIDIFGKKDSERERLVG